MSQIKTRTTKRIKKVCKKFYIETRFVVTYYLMKKKLLIKNKLLFAKELVRRRVLNFLFQGLFKLCR